MPIVRRQARCLSSNAFNPRRAIYGIFQHALVPLNSQQFHSSTIRLQAQERVQPKPNLFNAFVEEAEVSIEPTITQQPRTPSSRLLDTLRFIRNRNRDKLIRKVKHGEPEETPIPADATAEEKDHIATENLKIRYLNSLEPNKTLRPHKTGSYQGPIPFLSPIRRFAAGEPVFTELKFDPDVDATLIVAKNISQQEDAPVLDYEGHAVNTFVKAKKSAPLLERCPWIVDLGPLKGNSGLVVL
jgi:hypothetical protein